MLWFIMFGGLMLLCLAGLVYLIFCVRRLGFVQKLTHGSKAAAWAVGAAAVVLPTAIIWLAWGYMNALIVLLHLALFVGLAKLIFKKFKFAGTVALALAVVYLTVGYVQANNVWQKDYTVTTDKAVGTLRVALIADSHVGTTFDGEGLAPHIEEINKQNPDVVVVTGDFVDEDTSREDMVAACRALGQATPKFGTYFVFGNHDKGLYSNGERGYTGDDLVAELEKNGVTVLQDETVLIDNRFYLVGRQDASEERDFGGSRASIAELASALDRSKYSIVLDHQPRDYDAETAAGIDLVLSGHTHGGQMIPLMLFIRWFHIGDDNVYGLESSHLGDDNVYGYENHDRTDFIVTSGISDWAIQFKTGCRSEYVIVDIQGK